ncbi:MAG: hypothetical protein K2Q18_11220 [Bdellovibrionales bacterium]|nr:hypothetical protein [Bdellovibrionales bacterium]
MKKLLIALFLMTVSVANAKSFVPVSGMKFFCQDKLTGFDYALKINDIGDEAAQIKVYSFFELTSQYDDVVFHENSEESFFAYFGETELIFSITFPHNNLEEAYLTDGGVSRPLVCKLKNHKND